MHARFITEDPIRDGENWFSYVGNNPVNFIDPWGLEVEMVFYVTDIKDNGRGGKTATGVITVSNKSTGNFFVITDVKSGGIGSERDPKTFKSQPIPFGEYDILETTHENRLYQRLEAKDNNYGDDEVTFKGQPQHSLLRLHYAGSGLTWGCVSIPTKDEKRVQAELHNTTTTTATVKSKSKNPFKRTELQTDYGNLSVRDSTNNTARCKD